MHFGAGGARGEAYQNGGRGVGGEISKKLNFLGVLTAAIVTSFNGCVFADISL